ncbi:MAG: hypothetical protein LC794_05540 [Acidobacteria bacterium]|nr:hypothetical protein [Acidobacteriota bacterium]
MQNTGQGSEKRSYRVFLLLFVGLVAFSSAMKELNQVQRLTVQTSSLIAHWTDAIAPVEQHAILAQVETCEQTKIRVPPLPLPAPAVPLVHVEAPEIVAPALVPPTPPRAPVAPAAKPRRVIRPSHGDAEVRVLLSTDELLEKSLRDVLQADVTLKALKAKNRRHQIFITPDGRDVLLKSVNRSINLRSAS